MGFDLNKYLDEQLPVLDAVDLAASDSEDRPTVTDIWFWQLEQTVKGDLHSKGREPQDEYDHFHLYAHRDCLQTESDVEDAPDDVLLEALRLGTVDNWGWLRFIVRELGMTSLLINNWGLHRLKGFEDSSMRPEDERRAQAALYFIDLMSERGLDPLAQARRFATDCKEIYKRKYETELSEAELLEWMRANQEWIYFVYTCGSVVISPESIGGTEVLYSGEHRARFRSQIRAAADRRRLNWNAPRSCDCVERAEQNNSSEIAESPL